MEPSRVWLTDYRLAFAQNGKTVKKSIYLSLVRIWCLCSHVMSEKEAYHWMTFRDSRRDVNFEHCAVDIRMMGCDPKRTIVLGSTLASCLQVRLLAVEFTEELNCSLMWLIVSRTMKHSGSLLERVVKWRSFIPNPSLQIHFAYSGNLLSVCNVFEHQWMDFKMLWPCEYTLQICNISVSAGRSAFTEGNALMILFSKLFEHFASEIGTCPFCNSPRFRYRIIFYTCLHVGVYEKNDTECCKSTDKITLTGNISHEGKWP